VTKNEKEFIEVSKLFNFDYLKFKFIEQNNEDLKKDLKKSKYALLKNDYHLINLKQIIDDYKLDYFDSNISFYNSREN
jgi:hypothetical protein